MELKPRGSSDSANLRGGIMIEEDSVDSITAEWVDQPRSFKTEKLYPKGVPISELRNSRENWDLYLQRREKVWKNRREYDVLKSNRAWDKRRAVVNAERDLKIEQTLAMRGKTEKPKFFSVDDELKQWNKERWALGRNNFKELPEEAPRGLTLGDTHVPEAFSIYRPFFDRAMKVAGVPKSKMPRLMSGGLARVLDNELSIGQYLPLHNTILMNSKVMRLLDPQQQFEALAHEGVHADQFTSREALLASEGSTWYKGTIQNFDEVRYMDRDIEKAAYAVSNKIIPVWSAPEMEKRLAFFKRMNSYGPNVNKMWHDIHMAGGAVSHNLDPSQIEITALPARAQKTTRRVRPRTSTERWRTNAGRTSPALDTGLTRILKRIRRNLAPPSRVVNMGQTLKQGFVKGIKSGENNLVANMLEGARGLFKHL